MDTNKNLQTRLRTVTPPHTPRPWSVPAGQSPTIVQLRTSLESVATAHEREQILADFQQTLRTNGTPIIEEVPDSAPTRQEHQSHLQLFTFIWVGSAPNGVILQLNRISDKQRPEQTRLERIANTQVHALTLVLPSTWQGTYTYVPLSTDASQASEFLRPQAKNSQADPYARSSIPGEPRLAVARGESVTVKELWHKQPVPTESLGVITSPVNGAKLPVHAWSHPQANRASPVVVLTDGKDWRERVPVATKMNERIRAGRCVPLHIVFIDNCGAPQRQYDLAAYPDESENLLGQLRDLTAAHLSTSKFTIVGQSLGGLFAMLCALRHLQWVNAAIAQSPSLWWPRRLDPWESAPGWFDEFTELSGRHPASAPVFLQVGTLEWDMVERVGAAAAVLRAADALIAFEQFHGGHDILWWQAELPAAINRTLSPQMSE